MSKQFLSITFICLNFIIWPGTGFSQSYGYKFHHLNTSDGLSSDHINAIFKDSRGFIWIGTDDGLNLYDGYAIKIFRNNPGDSLSVSDNMILAIAEDNTGDLLIGTSSGGLNRFNFATDKFTHFKHNPGNPGSINHNKVNVIYKDTGDVFWIGTDGGLNKYITSTGGFIGYLVDRDSVSDSSNFVHAIFKENPNRIWIGTENGLFHFDPTTGIFNPVPLKPGYSHPYFEAYEKVINCIFKDSEGIIWIGTNWYLYRYDHGSMDWIGTMGLYVDESAPNCVYIHSIDEQSISGERFLWMATCGGLNRFDLVQSKFLHIMPESENPYSINSYALTTQYQDETGLLWIGHWEKGLDVLNLNENKYERPVLQDRAYFASSFLVDSEKNVWVGIGDDGLLQLDEHMNFVSYFKFRLPGGKDLQNCYIENMLEDRNGNIWIGNDLLVKGIFIFDPRQRHFEPIHLTIPPYYPQPKLSQPDDYNSFLEDRNGIIWFGTSHGLFRNKAGKPRELNSVEFSMNDSLVPLYIWDLLEDHSGNLWIATQDHGLFCVMNKNINVRDLSRWEFEQLFHLNFSGSIRTIFEDHSGIVWLGTSRGLFRINPADSIIIPVESQIGVIVNNPVYGIAEDRNHNLWLNSKTGLIRFDPDNTTGVLTKRFEMSDGLPFDHFDERAFYQAKDGRIFIGGIPATGEGFIYFDPEAIQDNKHIPPVTITDFKIRNEAVRLDSSIFAKKHIRLKHNQNFFSFEFATLNYISPEKNQYAYYLDGLEDGWIYSGTRRYVSYSSAPPGEYIFRVKGSNNDGYWNEKGTAMQISIAPPPWKTWWAYSLYVIFVAGAFGFWRRNDLKRQRLGRELELEHVQTEKLEELDHMKSRFFANISHEFRTPLTLILGPIEKHLPSVRDKALQQDMNIMHRNALRLQRLINQLLNLSKLESGQMKLQASEENMVELVKNYVQQFESLAKQKKIDLIFKSEREVILVFVNREKIEIILYNLLSNAFKFTQEGGKIEVATGIVSAPPLSPPYRVEGYFIVPPDLGGATGGAGKVECVMVSVIDTGIGIPNDQLPHIFDRFYQVGDSYTKDQEGTGIGLALTKELVELHHGQIEVESEGWIGTTFRIYLPLGKEHLKTEDIVGSRQLTVSRETPKRDKRKAISEDFEPVTCNPNLNRDFASLNLQPATDTLPKDAPILLIVEDNADLRLYLRGYLEQTYSVIEAADGQQGLDRAIEHIPDLVLSDVMMPEMDGYKLSKKLKTDERTSHIPIILLTARASIESKIEGLETGADDFITKPFDQHELLVRIQNLITQRKKLKEHYLQEIGIADLAVKEKSGETEFISLDQKFLRKAKTVIENHLSDNEFDVMQFGDEMNLSRTQLHRKLRALINQSASEFIRTIRLNYARILLTNKTGNISEIALEVGFTNPSYFSECFRKQFGLTPSEFVNPKFQAPKSK